MLIALAVALVFLLGSNLWLLRELERLRRDVRAYQGDVAFLDARVCQLLADVETESARQGDGVP